MKKRQFSFEVVQRRLFKKLLKMVYNIKIFEYSKGLANKECKPLNNECAGYYTGSFHVDNHICFEVSIFRSTRSLLDLHLKLLNVHLNQIPGIGNWTASKVSISFRDGYHVGVLYLRLKPLNENMFPFKGQTLYQKSLSKLSKDEIMNKIDKMLDDLSIYPDRVKEGFKSEFDYLSKLYVEKS